MKEFFSNLSLFLPQFFLGSILGMFLSVLGIILILRKMAFFGVTLSQVANFSFALSLFLGFREESFPLIFSVLILVPVFYFTRTTKSKSDTVLGIIFVSFGSLAQVLLSFGGNVQNHLLSAYFGDILTSEIKIKSFMLLVLGVNIILFIFLYQKIIFFSFDPDEYKVRNYPKYVEILFLAIVTSMLSISVNLLGSFYSAAQLIIPGFTALYLFRKLFLVILFSILLSFFATLIGFYISFQEIHYKNETIFLPTSSSIVVCLATLCLIFVSFRKWYTHK
jgi:ABC-type Mn2+/Zn2+ transport system permease subunit